MDIMNNMTVSRSKLTFSLIAFAALFISGSGIMIQDVSGAAGVPEFTAIHWNTTATKITFDDLINGTLRVADWSIRMTSTSIDGDSNTNALGQDGTVITISDVVNGTVSGSRTELGTDVVSYSSTATAKNKLDTSSVIADGLGWINKSSTIILIHDAIPTDATYFINYTNNNHNTNSGTTAESLHGYTAAASAKPIYYITESFNATALDQMPPSVVSAKKTGPKKIEILMSEPVANINSTGIEFTLSGSHDSVVGSLIATNGTNTIYLTTRNIIDPINSNPTITLNYATTPNASWITDSTHSIKHGGSQLVAGTGYESKQIFDLIHTNGGVGNRMSNFTVNIINWLEVGMYGDLNTCYDCTAPTVTDVKVSLDSSIPIAVTDDNAVQINAGIGDTVSIMVTIADNLGGDSVPFAGLYTNFGDTPDNLFYANNFDSAKQMSTSYYEWNVSTDDTAFDNDGAITWTDATATINPDRTKTITYTMTINDSVESSQVWVDLGDKVGNFAKSALPITLEVSGPTALTFASDDTQKVVSFFNESILLAIVSQWTTSSSNDATNVEQLSSVLGIENQLPTWTTNLASWVADDKIDVADMIVAVEYVINQ